jgi:hypothetical protein
LIGVEDEDSCGRSELGETPQEQSDEEAHQPPAESEVLHGNQQRYIKPTSKKPSKIGFHTLVMFYPSEHILNIWYIRRGKNNEQKKRNHV